MPKKKVLLQELISGVAFIIFGLILNVSIIENSEIGNDISNVVAYAFGLILGIGFIIGGIVLVIMGVERFNSK